jgi:hypothetical protein
LRRSRSVGEEEVRCGWMRASDCDRYA